jgi:hypothetical protein
MLNVRRITFFSFMLFLSLNLFSKAYDPEKSSTIKPLAAAVKIKLKEKYDEILSNVLDQVERSLEQQIFVAKSSKKKTSKIKPDHGKEDKIEADRKSHAEQLHKLTVSAKNKWGKFRAQAEKSSSKELNYLMKIFYKLRLQKFIFRHDILQINEALDDLEESIFSKYWATDSRCSEFILILRQIFSYHNAAKYTALQGAADLFLRSPLNFAKKNKAFTAGAVVTILGVKFLWDRGLKEIINNLLFEGEPGSRRRGRFSKVTHTFEAGPFRVIDAATNQSTSINCQEFTAVRASGGLEQEGVQCCWYSLYHAECLRAGKYPSFSEFDNMMKKNILSKNGNAQTGHDLQELMRNIPFLRALSDEYLMFEDWKRAFGLLNGDNQVQTVGRPKEGIFGFLDDYNNPKAPGRMHDKISELRDGLRDSVTFLMMTRNIEYKHEAVLKELKTNKIKALEKKGQSNDEATKKVEKYYRKKTEEETHKECQAFFAKMGNRGMSHWVAVKVGKKELTYFDSIGGGPESYSDMFRGLWWLCHERELDQLRPNDDDAN